MSGSGGGRKKHEGGGRREEDGKKEEGKELKDKVDKEEEIKEVNKEGRRKKGKGDVPSASHDLATGENLQTSLAATSWLASPP